MTGHRFPNRPVLPLTPVIFDDTELLERKRLAGRMLRDALIMLVAFIILTALFHLGR